MEIVDAGWKQNIENEYCATLNVNSLHINILRHIWVTLAKWSSIYYDLLEQSNRLCTLVGHGCTSFCFAEMEKYTAILGNLVVSVIIHTTWQSMHWCVTHGWNAMCHFFQLEAICLSCILGAIKSNKFWNTFPNNCILIVCLHRCFTTFAFVNTPVLCQNTS